ncbi:Uncharacterized protein OS=Nodularia spumigena CCY9414 GN=NSP_51940 PE=4 SV=1 [Gemmataceae bacterium]|nr:Uncharacterized protein OS=Nodularia spumigena CCY9414 GN=NSP_51940 PE=4 SV=1 [Gemmataceae bacterium]VTU00409.1 Uncharacterized protein OS=Nodularia spumigena CCY9414 GN=NSP_51940 PE=4 SV=1 [Gemmataceae bacterium]
MAGPFDAAFKQLVDACAADWVGFLAPLVGLPASVPVEPLDTDLSTVQPTIDKVFRLNSPGSGLLHIEPQSSWDGGFPDRLHLYNSLLFDRHGGPVYTIALLLRREASAPNLTGLVSRAYADGTVYQWFRYTVVRLWELQADQLLATGLGTTPLALLTDDAAPRLPEVVGRFAERALRESPTPDAGNVLLSCAFLLLGLRYDEAVARSVFQGVQRMRESSTYQGILREGRVEGRVEGHVERGRDDVLLVLRTRFGAVPPDVENRVRATADPSVLQEALVRAVQVARPEELFP